MKIKTLSVQQPYAAFICAGVKTVENRTWNTDYRGRMLIHACGDEYSFFGDGHLPQSFLDKWYDYTEKSGDECICSDNAPESIKYICSLMAKILQFYGISQDDPTPIQEWIRPAVKEHGFFFQTRSIIGECVLADIVKDSDSEFAKPDHYHWILTDPVWYDRPIVDVIGRQRLWNFNLV